MAKLNTLFLLRHRSGFHSHVEASGAITMAITLLYVTGTPATANEANNQFVAATEEQRRAAFQIILAGAGEACNTVTRAYFQGESTAGDAVWNVDCVADGSYSIRIATSGNT